jgi:LAS superfamily LD-carboxypeptidase LdcB
MVLRRVRLLVLVLVLAALPAGALAQQPDPSDVDEARERLEQLEQDAADARTRVDAARAHLDALEPALRRTSVALDDAEAAATAAGRAAAEARSREERLEERLAEAREQLADNRDELADLARDAYKYGPGAAAPMLAAVDQLSSSSNPNEIADVVHMVDVVLGDRALVVDESVRLIEETRFLTDRVARVRRERDREAAAARQAEQQAAEQHADMLALLDEADRAVTAERTALAEIESQQATTRERVEELEAARERAVAAARDAVGVVAAGRGLVTVGGITVAASLGPQLEALLEAARADGIVLGGSGYRSPETTVRLRRANGCPDVYDSPASACRVPTARPGTSMHEQGLAIDFTWQGQTICYPRSPSQCSGNAAFDWLRAHAAEYGLYGLTSEAWHWSTNGD